MLLYYVTTNVTIELLFAPTGCYFFGGHGISERPKIFPIPCPAEGLLADEEAVQIRAVLVHRQLHLGRHALLFVLRILNRDELQIKK